MNKELKAEYLDINKPFVKNVKYQRFYTCSMLAPNCFPMSKRDSVRDQDIYGFKLHGVYEDEKEQEEHSDKVRNIVKNYEVFGDKIGELIEFDVDIADTERNSKIVYKEEEQNEINNRQYKQEICKTYKDNKDELDFSEILNQNPIENNLDIDENYFSQKEQTFVWSINEARFACVSFYTPEMIPNIPDKFKNKKIAGHIVHGFFDKVKDAKTYAYSQRKKYPMIFIMQTGNWCAFDVNLVNNSNPDPQSPIIRTQKLNDFMKLYLDSLEQTALEEKERKDKYLKDANVVTEEYTHLKNNEIKVDDERTVEETNNEDEITLDSNNFNTEMDINKKLDEIKERREQLEHRVNNNQNISMEEMESKFNRMKELYSKLNN
jgi:hypothetical protein